MFCVGLTGNIASGKTTVATLFEKLGIDVISADEIAKKLTMGGQPAFHDIVNHFGESVLTTSNELNRRHLRTLIFNHPDERLWLQELLHPLIRKQIKQEIKNTQSPYCLIELPLIPDKSNYPYLNRILLVLADREQQIARLMARDNNSRENALAILATQADETKHRSIADDILINRGSIKPLKKQVEALHAQYIQYSMK